MNAGGGKPPAASLCSWSGSEWPFPGRDVGPVDAVLVRVLLARNLLVGKLLANTGGGGAQAGDAVDGVHGQGEPVRLVADGQLQRRVDVALLLVAAHVEVVLTRPAVCQPVDQP